MLAPGLSEADPGSQHFATSGLVTGVPQPLRHKEIPGFLSAEQIAPHHTAHYGGALKGYSAADARLVSDGASWPQAAAPRAIAAASAAPRA